MLCTLIDIDAVLAIICQSESSPTAKRVQFTIRHLCRDRAVMLMSDAQLLCRRKAFKVAEVMSLLATALKYNGLIKPARILHRGFVDICLTNVQ